MKKKITVKALQDDMSKAVKIAGTMTAQGDQLGTIINKWLKLGKTGYTAIKIFSGEMKKDENQLALNVVSTACKRYFKAENVDLSIKGLGFKTENSKKQPVEISPKVKPENDGGKDKKDDPITSTLDIQGLYAIVDAANKEQLKDLRIEIRALEAYIAKKLA
jgi:hypothetical protein